MSKQQHIAMQTWRVTPDLMCILDAAGTFVAVNPAWTSTLGWTQDEIVGQPFLNFLHEDDIERSITAFEKVKVGMPVLRFENRYKTKDEEYRWFSWVAVPEDDVFYCTIRDVTEEKLREQTISAQRDEATLREQFIAILGHDLRNPVAAIMAGIRLISQDTHTDRSKLILGEMQASSVRMLELIDNMMDFARARLGDGIGLKRVMCTHLEDEISDLVSEIQTAHPSVEINLSTSIEDEIYCDAPRVLQVLSNLLGNAVTHGTKGAPITVKASSHSGELHLSVSNQGTPIPENVQKSLFEPFFKGNASENTHGLGLGLYICSQIAQAHDGKLSMETDESATTFTLELPAFDEAADS
ncbi:PAS domain S-box protein [Rhodobacterales bacterium]|nr:PAS domain S-box protein [Rhodobacterales bacterium]